MNEADKSVRLTVASRADALIHRMHPPDACHLPPFGHWAFREARGAPEPRSGLSATSNEAEGPVPPRPSGLGRFWLLASLLIGHRAKAMLPLRLPAEALAKAGASPEAKIASSKTGSYFCTDPKAVLTARLRERP